MSIVQLCGTDFPNTGNAGCVDKSERGVERTIFLTTKSFQWDTLADFADLSVLEAAIKAKEVFPIQEVDSFEIQDEDAELHQSDLGAEALIRHGNYRRKFFFNKNTCSMKALQDFTQKSMRVVYADINGNIRGYSPDGTVVKGFDIDLLFVGKQTTPETGGVSLIPIYIGEKNSRQWNTQGVLLNPTWEPSDLAGLTDVSVEVVGTPTATELIVKVYSACGYTSAGAVNEIAIKGIDPTDIVVTKTADSSTQTVAFTDNTDGTYTGVGTAIVAGEVNLKTPPNQSSTGLLIESLGAATFAI